LCKRFITGIAFKQYYMLLLKSSFLTSVMMAGELIF